MKKKRIIITVIILVLLITGVIGWKVMTNYSRILKANWGFELPVYALCSEIYEKDAGPSFHGDGVRYHVYEYKYEDSIDLMFVWETKERTSIYGKSYSDEADSWLDQIEVPDEWRPDYENCFYRYRTQDDNSQLLIFWDRELNRLYIAESFI